MPASAKFISTALVTGIVAGALDLTAAVVVYNSTYEGVLRFIARGFFTKAEAAKADQAMIWWGLLFHFFIAVVFAFFYFTLYPKLRFLRRHLLLSAVLLGLFVWIVMNMIVLPLSQFNTPVIPPDKSEALKSAAILVVCIGLPIAFGAWLYYKRPRVA
jgi:hypothetical protein